MDRRTVCPAREALELRRSPQQQAKLVGLRGRATIRHCDGVAAPGTVVKLRRAPVRRQLPPSGRDLVTPPGRACRRARSRGRQSPNADDLRTESGRFTQTDDCVSQPSANLLARVTRSRRARLIWTPSRQALIGPAAATSFSNQWSLPSSSVRRARSRLPPRRLGDVFGLGLHLSFGRLAFAWGLGDEPSALPA